MGPFEVGTLNRVLTSGAGAGWRPHPLAGALVFLGVCGWVPVWFVAHSQRLLCMTWLWWAPAWVVGVVLLGLRSWAWSSICSGTAGCRQHLRAHFCGPGPSALWLLAAYLCSSPGRGCHCPWSGLGGPLDVCCPGHLLARFISCISSTVCCSVKFLIYSIFIIYL